MENKSWVWLGDFSLKKRKMRDVFISAYGHLDQLWRRDLLERLFKLAAKRIMGLNGWKFVRQIQPWNYDNITNSKLEEYSRGGEGLTIRWCFGKKNEHHSKTYALTQLLRKILQPANEGRMGSCPVVHYFLFLTPRRSSSPRSEHL